VVLAVAIALLLVLSVLAFRFVSPTTSRATSPVNPGNGLTFNQAFAPVNATVANHPGGPWYLISALGVATELPESPLPIFGQYVGLNATMRMCGNLTGVTVWNSSGIPVFTGDLNSGAAPFWSFVLKNSSESFLYATSVLGVGYLYPVSVSTLCLRAAGLADWGSINESVTRDSQLVASVAYSAGGKQFANAHSPLAEYYMLGSSQLTELDASPFGWVVNYFRCDLVGVYGAQNYTAVGTTADATSWFVDRGWLTCTVSEYSLLFDPSVENVTPSGASGAYLMSTFQVGFPPTNGSTFYDGWGLQAWMTRLQLVNDTDIELPSSRASCLGWIPSLQDCPSNASGWFAVLLSANGSWLDSYPAANESGTWSIPNVLITSHDRIVIVCPSGWASLSDTLKVTSAPSAPGVTGTQLL